MSNAWIHGGWVAVFDCFFLFRWGGALPVLEGDGWGYDVKMTAAKQSTTQRILTIILI